MPEGKETQVKVAVAVVVILAVLVGIWAGSLAAMDKFDDPLELSLLKGAYIWVLIILCPAFLIIVKVARLLGVHFVEDKSRSVSLSEAVRSSWTNTGIVNALVLTVAAALWMADRPGEMEDLATHWFIICVCCSTMFSLCGTVNSVLCLMFTDSLSSTAVADLLETRAGIVGYPVCHLGMSLLFMSGAFCMWNYLTYGANALIVTGCGFLGIIITFVTNFRMLEKYENHVDGDRHYLKESSLVSYIEQQVEQGKWWLYSDEDDQETFGTLVEEEKLPFKMEHKTQNFICADNDIKEVRLFHESFLLDYGVSFENSSGEEVLSTKDAQKKLLHSQLVPTCTKDKFLLLTENGVIRVKPVFSPRRSSPVVDLRATAKVSAPQQSPAGFLA